MLRTIFFLITLGLLSSACSVYSPSSQTVSRPTTTHSSVESATLTEADIRMIRAYYAGARPSDGRKGGLPPGIAKNLQRGKPLPPGIAKQYLPQYLLVRLPRAGDGLEYVVVAGKLLLVEITTQIVRRVLLNAVFD